MKENINKIADYFNTSILDAEEQKALFSTVKKLEQLVKGLDEKERIMFLVMSKGSELFDVSMKMFIKMPSHQEK